MKAALKSVHPDASLNLTALADRLAALGTSQIATFTLPAYPDHVGDAAILRLDQEKATALLSFFGGQPPAPADVDDRRLRPRRTPPAPALPPAPGATPTTNPLTAFAPPPTSAPIGTVPDQSASCG